MPNTLRSTELTERIETSGRLTLKMRMLALETVMFKKRLNIELEPEEQQVVALVSEAMSKMDALAKRAVAAVEEALGPKRT